MVGTERYLLALQSEGRNSVKADWQVISKFSSFREGFDLVILDLTIPGRLGGKQVLEALLRIDPRVKAVASSGYSNDPIMSEPAKYGFKAKLSKPYLRDDLIKVLSGVLADP